MKLKINKMKRLKLIALLMLSTAWATAQNYTIRGYITDSKSQETLIGATILDKNSGKGSITNEYGFYSLTLPHGNVSLSIGYVGYRQFSNEFRLESDTLLNLSLSEITELSEVTINGNRLELGVQGSQMSAIDLPVEQIKAVPAMFGETDVLKALQLLPGVQSGSEGSAGLLVRGGNPDENLLLLDGVPVYNVNHLMGMFSTFNPDAIKNVTLYKGSFPAHYCGRLSSVVDIRMKDGDMNDFHGNFSIGFVSSKLNLEGPINKGKTSFNISARRTYSDLLLNSALLGASLIGRETEKYMAGYYFYDLNAKINHKFSDNDRLYFSWYSGDDDVYFRYKYKSTSEGNEFVKLGWKWGNVVSALRWNHVINPKLFMDLTASYTQYRHNMDMGLQTEYRKEQEKTKESINMHSGIFDKTMRADFHYNPTPDHEIRFGSYLTHHTFRPDVASYTSYTQNADTTINNTTELAQKPIRAMEWQVYAEDNMSVTDLLKVNLGLSSSLFSVNGHSYYSLEPRLSGRMLLSDNLSVKAGYAYMTQYVHLLSNNSISLPTDLWVPVTNNIRPENSHQIAGGLFYNIEDLADFSVEAYYKRMNNLLEYKEGASFMTSDTDWQDKVAMGRGWSYGAEFLAQRSIGRLNGWVSYTWSRSRRQFDREGMVLNGGRPFNAKYDRRHDFSITGNYKFSDRFDMSATWMYATGNCGSLYTQYYDSDNMSSVYGEIGYFEERNNFRMNPYHRLDLNFNWHKELNFREGAERVFNLSIFNAYNNRNPYLVFIYEEYNSTTQQTYKALRQVTIFPIIPTISYSISF